MVTRTALSPSPHCNSLEDPQKEKSCKLSRAYFLSQDLSLPVSSTCLYSEHRFKDQSAKKKENKGDFFSLLISEAALTQFSSKACSWDGSNLVLAAPPNLKSIRNSKTKAALVPTSSLNPLDFLGQLSCCLCSRLVYCKIPEEATEAIQEAIFKSALAFLLGWFQQRCHKTSLQL